MIDIELTEEALGNDPQARSALFDTAEETELAEIQTIRKDLTNLLIKDGNGRMMVPEKTSDKVLLAQLLDGRERQVLTKARLKIAAKADAGAQNLADIVAQALRTFKPGTTKADPEDRVIPGEFLEIEPVPGEMDIGNLPMTLESIKN